MNLSKVSLKQMLFETCFHVGVQVIVIMSVFQVSVVNSFSYNVKARIEFYPNNINNGQTYFGYSLLLRSGSKPSLVVGAPRASSEYLAHRNIDNPGAMYICEIPRDSNRTSCQQKILETEGNSQHFLPSGKSYYHKKDNMWLGMTLDGSDYSNGTLVMCAPRWINKHNSDYHLANGLCYGIPNTEQTSHTSLLIPLVDRVNQGFVVTKPDEYRGVNTYYYAYGQAGISMKFSDNGKELIIGAPGIYVWTGSVIRYKVSKQIYGGDYYIKNTVPNPYYTSELHEDGYFGYSVDSGIFISQRSTLYVAGAPRGADYKGKVFLFDFPLRENNRMIILAILEGHQIGEYFGSTLLAVDINQDGLKDLIVGAPMYAEKNSWDQGRVYVYMNQDKGRLIEQDATISGNLVAGARFGTTISRIGDLNGDSFTDVAIGAPYEDEGRGAVYIYLGSDKGLNPVYSQRITVEGTLGFGLGISKGNDIDYNSCNDIAIGAYDSGRVFLLKCHPSIGVETRMEATPSEISTKDTNFSLKVCLKFVGTGSISTGIEAKLAVDTDLKRADLKDSNSEIISIFGRVGNEYCKDLIVSINNNETDYSRPIEIKLDLNLTRDPLENSEFCKDCPVLNPSTDKELLLRVPFASGCGNDFICQPDLKLSVQVLTRLPFIIGSASKVALNISVVNNGEPAFLTQAKLIPPVQAPLLRVPPKCRLIDSLLFCDLENPLLPQEESYVIVELDTSLLTSANTLLNFNVSVESRGEEVSLEDNNYEVSVPLKTVANVVITGQAGPDIYKYINPNSKNQQNLSISHTYEVHNLGPTSLDAFRIQFYLPTTYRDQETNVTYSLVNVFEPKDTTNHAPFLCQPINGEFYFVPEEGHSVSIGNDTDDAQYSTVSAENTSTSETTPSTIYYTEGQANVANNGDIFVSEFFNALSGDILPTRVEEENLPNIKSLHVNCTNRLNVGCFIVDCVKSGGLPVTANGAHLIFNMQLNVTNLETVLKKEKSLILSTYAVNFLSISQKVFGWSRSVIIGGNPSPASIPIWIIILAVVAGIILLSLLTFVLYKFDFFKRKTKTNLELLKNQDNSIYESVDEHDEQ